MRGAELTGRGYVNLAGDLPRATEVAGPVFARLVGARAGLDGRRCRRRRGQLKPIEEVGGRERGLREAVRIHLRRSRWAELRLSLIHISEPTRPY